jgi:hypothetical protein
LKESVKWFRIGSDLWAVVVALSCPKAITVDLMLKKDRVRCLYFGIVCYGNVPLSGSIPAVGRNLLYAEDGVGGFSETLVIICKIKL